MVYLLLFIILCTFAVIEVVRAKKNALEQINSCVTLSMSNYTDYTDKKSYSYLFLLIVLTAFSALRYGQGSDYFNYMYGYVITEPLSFESFTLITSAEEWGYRVFLTGIFRYFDLPYEAFISFLTITTMFFFHKVISKFSPLKTLSLLLFFPTLYMSYVFSTFRQCLAISLFLGLLLDCLLDKKYAKYYILCLLLTLIHSTAAVLLLIPICLKIKLKVYKILLCFSFLLPFVGYIIDQTALSAVILGAYGNDYTYLNTIAFIFPLAERVIMLSICLLLYKNVKDKNELMKILLKIYILGFLIYISLLLSPLVSQRMSAYFKSVEIILVPIFIYSLMKTKKNIVIRKTFIISKGILLFLVIMYCSVFTVKNLSSYTDHGDYYEKSFIKYPYVSIFNKSDIHDKRVIPRNIWGHIYTYVPGTPKYERE